MAKTLAEHNFFDFDATMVAHSRNLQGDELATMVVTLPRIVLAEAKTHRIMSTEDGGTEHIIYPGLGFNDEDLFTRNSASSRAIPFNKMVERVRTNAYIPKLWQEEHKGMQGTKYITDPIQIEAREQIHLDARDAMVRTASQLSAMNTTKQICNRYLEPFLWHTIIVSTTEWENFFELRCPQYKVGTEKPAFRSWKDLMSDVIKSITHRPDEINYWQNTDLVERFQDYNKSAADVHIQLAAEAMWDCLNESDRTVLCAGEYHIPFCNDIDPDRLIAAIENTTLKYGDALAMVSIASCAKLSYGNIDVANSDYVEDLKLYDRLKAMKHSSPFEHVAQTMDDEEYDNSVKGYQGECSEPETGWVGNFRGFKQERYILGL